jgi:hypothetical protein
LETTQKDPHEAGLFALPAKQLVSEVSPVDAQSHEAAEPVLTGAVEPVWIPVEALAGVAVGALAVTLVGE